jgi:superfamily II DNA or RNA helicase
MGYFDRVRAGVRVVTEIDRILALPRVEPDTSDLTGELATPSNKLTLRPLQSAALRAIASQRGALLPIGVGHGKSWVALLAATVLDVDAAIILAPASTIEPL